MNKALASLAIIKVNWDDQRKDYIQIFIPFIVALLRKKRYKTIDINIVCKDFEKEFGLVIPYHPMITILERARRHGYIKKIQSGYYIPLYEKLSEDDFSDVALEQEQKYSNVINKFLIYCQGKGENISEEQIDSIIISFFKEHDLDILFASFSDNLTILPFVDDDQAKNQYVNSYLINSFVINAYKSDPETFGFIIDLSIGHFLANTLLYNQDYNNFYGRFTGNYYLDTGLLFNIIGINGENRRIAYEEFIKLLIENGAKVFIFRHTYEEFVGILENCMNWLENPNIDISKASKSLLYFIDNKCSCSDIERLINNISNILESLHIDIVSMPDPNEDQQYQINEEALEKMIIDKYKENDPYFDKDEKDYTIRQDVKSIAAIFKLRKGEKPLKISDARFLFITTNSTLAYVSRIFEISQSLEEKFFFIPTSLTDVFIGTIAWTNSPAKVLEISQKRLIANCYAALQPTRKLLRKYVDEIENLKTQGNIKDNEANVLKVSRVARNLLIDETMGDPDRFTDKTANEILEDYRETIRKEEKDKLIVREENVIEKEKALEVEKKALGETYTKEIHEKDQNLEKINKELVRYEKRVNQIADTFAAWISRFFVIITVIMAILALIAQNWPDFLPFSPLIKTLCIIVAFIFGLLSIVNGFNILGNKDRLKQFIRLKVKQFFEPE